MKKETLMGAVAKIASLLVSATYSTDTDTDYFLCKIFILHYY